MKFEKVDRPNWISEYDPLFAAVLEAHKEHRAVRVALEGRHWAGPAQAIRSRLKNDPVLRDKFSVSASRDLENDAVTIFLHDNDEQRERLAAISKQVKQAKKGKR